MTVEAFEGELDEAGVKALAADLAGRLSVGDVVLLEGELGAGKTTLVRALLVALGWKGAVRSPTFTLIQLYDTSPPVLHADLYRVTHAEGLGLEDELAHRVCLIEWPDRLGDWLDPAATLRVELRILDEGRRRVTVTPPTRPIG